MVCAFRVTGVVQGATGEGTHTAAETRTVGGTHTMEEAEVEAVTAAGTEGGATEAGQEHLLQERGVLLWDTRLIAIILLYNFLSKDDFDYLLVRLPIIR